jgi:hypothetical protein
MSAATKGKRQLPMLLLLLLLLLLLYRNLFSPNGPSVLLTNVTLLLPPKEAAQLAAMAAEAAERTAPGLAQFQLSFPSGNGIHFDLVGRLLGVTLLTKPILQCSHQ